MAAVARPARDARMIAGFALHPACIRGAQLLSTISRPHSVARMQPRLASRTVTSL